MQTREVAASEFRRFYDRGDLPLQVDFDGAQRKVQWKVRMLLIIVVILACCDVNSGAAVDHFSVCR
jgi:hypothetical protein